MCDHGSHTVGNNLYYEFSTMSQFTTSIAQNDELEALVSIYADELKIIDSHGNKKIVFNCLDYITVTFEVQPNYPAESRPTFSTSFSLQTSTEIKSKFMSCIQSVIDDNSNSECLFPAIELIKNLAEEYGGNNIPLIASSQQRGLERNCLDCKEDSNLNHVKSNENKLPDHMVIIHGEITKDRKSSFQSHICEVRSMEDTILFHQYVLSDKRVAAATHNIFAYRFTLNSICYHDFDDDGEAAAGGRLAEMMRLMKVENVAVIVSRWFGGILLGSDRFKLINNSARRLLEDNGFGEIQRRQMEERALGGAETAVSGAGIVKCRRNW